MSISTHMTVVTEDNEFTKIYKLQSHPGLAIYTAERDSTNIGKQVPDSLNEVKNSSKKYIVRAKNSSDKEFKIVCDENTEFLCRKDNEYQFVSLAKLDLSTLIVTDEGQNKLCLLTKKSDITLNTKDSFVDVIKGVPFICCHFIVKNV